MFVQIRNFSLSSDCLISNMILLWFLSALFYVICCYGNMYSLDSLPISFLASLLFWVVQHPTVIIMLELKLQHTGLY